MTERQLGAGGPPRPGEFEQDLDPELQGEERRELLALAVRLTEGRPVPRPGLRSAIRSRLIGSRATPSRSRIAGLIFGYATSGALLLVVAAAGLVGVGPFAS